MPKTLIFFFPFVFVSDDAEISDFFFEFVSDDAEISERLLQVCVRARVRARVCARINVYVCSEKPAG